jgi:hypothetical protein
VYEHIKLLKNKKYKCDYNLIEFKMCEYSKIKVGMYGKEVYTIIKDMKYLCSYYTDMIHFIAQIKNLKTEIQKLRYEDLE